MKPVHESVSASSSYQTREKRANGGKKNRKINGFESTVTLFTPHKDSCPLCDRTCELLYILITRIKHLCARVDYGELGWKQPGLCTARGERRTRLDALAGGRQAAFGEDVKRKEKKRGRRGNGQGKRCHNRYANRGENMQIRQSLEVIHRLIQLHCAVFVGRGTFMKRFRGAVGGRERKANTREGEDCWMHVLIKCNNNFESRERVSSAHFKGFKLMDDL